MDYYIIIVYGLWFGINVLKITVEFLNNWSCMLDGLYDKCIFEDCLAAFFTERQATFISSFPIYGVPCPPPLL